jgi:hypothetical protein
MSIKISEETGTPGWLELYDLSLHSDVEARLPQGPYLRGQVDFEHRRFEPDELTILGTPMINPSEFGGTPGWVELSSLQFYGDMTAIQPSPPYIHGLMDSAQHFYPDEPFTVITD